jgi:NAD(P)-dependent dehydrogenase (short-subunit alcohol dehydrogenase family)
LSTKPANHPTPSPVLGIEVGEERRRILVTGATGQVGDRLIRHLLNAGGLDVVAAARTPQKANSLGVPVMPLDYDREGTPAGSAPEG